VPSIGYLEAGVNDCRGFAAFRSNPAANKALWLLTPLLSSHYIKMLKLFLFGVHNLFRYIVVCTASSFQDVISFILGRTRARNIATNAITTATSRRSKA
jgi:hypothetical protein